MKKLLVALLSFVLVISVCAVYASAEGSALIPTDADVWYDEPVGGTTCTVTFEDGKAIFSGSIPGTWPAIYTNYAPENCIIANIDEYSLHYDFTVESGYTNISLYFSTDAVTPNNGLTYPISNTSLGDIVFDTGSGDMAPGHYSGVIKLSDFVNSTTNFDSTAFDKTYVNENNELVFSGVKVYSVQGGVITIDALEIVANDEVPADEPSEDTEESSEEPADESSEAPADESSEDVASVDESSADESVADTVEDASFPYWIIAVVAAVIVIAVVCVLFVGKKKK